MKFDGEKTRLELIPPELIWGSGRGLTYGGKKYAPGNWAKGAGFKWSRLYGALQRHLNSFWGGEDNDPESGLSHLDHAACMLSFLMAHHKRSFGTDDRIEIGVSLNGKKPPNASGSRKDRNAKVASRRKDTNRKRKHKSRPSA